MQILHENKHMYMKVSREVDEIHFIDYKLIIGFFVQPESLTIHPLIVDGSHGVVTFEAKQDEESLIMTHSIANTDFSHMTTIFKEKGIRALVRTEEVTVFDSIHGIEPPFIAGGNLGPQ